MPYKASLGRSLLVAGVVAIGIAAAWCMVALWTGTVIQRTMQSGDVYEQIYTDVEGEPVIVRTSRDVRATESVLTLTGQPKNVTSQDLLYPQYLYGGELSQLMRSTGDWQQRLRSANDAGIPPMYWYLVHDGQRNGRAYGVGYHSRTKTIVGYFGRQGFSESQPPRDQWFHIPGEQGLMTATTLTWGVQEPVYQGRDPNFLFLAEGKLWKADLAHRELEVLLECPQAYAIGQVWQIVSERPQTRPGVHPPSAQEITPSVVLVRQPENVMVVDPLKEATTTYPLPEDVRDKTLAAAVLPDSRLLLFALNSYMGGDNDVLWIKPSGEIDRQQQVRLARWTREPTLAEQGWLGAVAAPLPTANALVTAILPQGLVATRKADSYSTGLRMVLATTWPSILAIILVGIASAIAAYRRQRRFSLPHAPARALFAFVFGLPGWIAYRFHRAWPVLEECPACHQASPRDRESCIDCGADFPPPPLKGVEVFA